MELTPPLLVALGVPLLLWANEDWQTQRLRLSSLATGYVGGAWVAFLGGLPLHPLAALLVLLAARLGLGWRDAQVLAYVALVLGLGPSVAVLTLTYAGGGLLILWRGPFGTPLVPVVAAAAGVVVLGMTFLFPYLST